MEVAMVEAVLKSSMIKKYCSQSLARSYPGAMSHSRWITTAKRLLHLYVASECTSDNLKTMATYAMRCNNYVVLHQNETLVYYGYIHLWRTISRSQYLP